jgi:hypothetical protein
MGFVCVVLLATPLVKKERWQEKKKVVASLCQNAGTVNQAIKD